MSGYSLFFKIEIEQNEVVKSDNFKENFRYYGQDSAWKKAKLKC